MLVGAERMKRLVMLASFLFVVFCLWLPAEDIQTDYDHAADFSRYKTFMWIKEPITDDPLMKRWLVDAVNAQLQSKGLRLVTANADLGISANAATQEQHTLE